MKGYGKLISGLIAAWFVVAAGGSAMGWFSNTANRLGLAVGVAALAPLLVFAVWFAASAEFRRFAMSLNPRVLTALQSWRMVGFTFVLLEAHGLLPALFARPAGYGDMAIGATAAYVAWKAAEPAHRGWFLLWQGLGILDLVTAVTLGTTVGLIDPGSTPMTLKTVLPLSLIPTFFVPLFMIFHVISSAQARRWKSEPKDAGRFGVTVQSAAH